MTVGTIWHLVVRINCVDFSSTKPMQKGSSCSMEMGLRRVTAFTDNNPIELKVNLVLKKILLLFIKSKNLIIWWKGETIGQVSHLSAMGVLYYRKGILVKENIILQ